MPTDPELQAMSLIAESLTELEHDQVRRVLRWAMDRFDIETSEPVNNVQVRNGVDVDSGTAGAYEHIADLMDAAGPKTGVEKALVAGYWYQIILGQPDFTGYQVNSELKNLGHGLTNVTTALDKLIRRKPALALQLAKGKSRMAHKKYKVTQAGVRHVEAMIAARIDTRGE